VTEVTMPYLLRCTAALMLLKKSVTDDERAIFYS